MNVTKRGISFLSLGLLLFVAGQHAAAQTTIAYTGTFWSQAMNQGGTVQMTVTYWPNDSISGYVDNDNYPGEALLCGAGNFTGYRTGDSLYHQYPSFDQDTGCGFDWGIVTYLRSQVHNGLDSISGGYYINPTPGVAGFGYYNLTAVLLPTTITDRVQGRTLVTPNPTTGPMTLSCSTGHCEASISILDARGRSVQQAQIQRGAGHTSIDLSSNEAGIYFAVLQYEDGKREVLRVVKE